MVIKVKIKQTGQFNTGWYAHKIPLLDRRVLGSIYIKFCKLKELRRQ